MKVLQVSMVSFEGLSADGADTGNSKETSTGS
jgi:hypothetical protein